MPSVPSRAFEVPMLAAAAIAAAVLLLPAPFVGVPLLLMPIAWFLYTQRPVRAAIVTIAGLGGVVLMAASDSPKLFAPLVSAGLVEYVVIVAGGWWAALALRTRPVHVVALVLGFVVLFAVVGGLAVGLSLPGGDGLVTPVSDAVTKLIVDQQGDGRANAEVVREAKREIERRLPGLAVGVSAVAAMLSVVALGWTAGKAEVQVRRVPALEDVDLSIHFVWPLIVSLGLGAAATLMKQGDGWMATAGDNLFVVSRLAMLVQGLGVAAFFMKKARVPTVLRVSAYVFLAVGPVVPELVAGFGTADLWANFRRLPRGGSSTPSASLEETSGRV